MELATAMEWNMIQSEEDMEQAWAQSGEKPVLIFKHSTRCSISDSALNRIERNFSTLASHMNLYFIDLLRYRGLSDAIAAKTGVEHASPQALILRNGTCTYHCSHFSIQASALIDAVSNR